MTAQPNFFELNQYGALSMADLQTVGAPHNGTPTSIEAARHIAPKAPNKREQVYAYIHAQGTYGATDQEIQRATGIGESTERPRRIELKESRRIRDSGRTRPTLSGEQAVVWVAEEYAPSSLSRDTDQNTAPGEGSRMD